MLVESREATERVWLAWAVRNGIGEEELRSAMHGVRSVEVVRALRPELDAVAEAEEIERRQAEDVGGLRAIPGAAEALRALREDRVAVVTSATRPLADGAARRGGHRAARRDGLRRATCRAGSRTRRATSTAARRLGVDPAEALVVEDAPPGIEAGRAAGAATVGVTSTHAAAELAAADVVIETLEELPAVLARSFDASAVLLGERRALRVGSLPDYPSI